MSRSAAPRRAGCAAPSDIIEVCQNRIHHDPFHLSTDGNFSWEEVECLGACVNAPMVLIWKDTYEDLTTESFGKVLDGFAAGNPPKPGPQIDRQFAAPVGGPTTLKHRRAQRQPRRGQRTGADRRRVEEAGRGRQCAGTAVAEAADGRRHPEGQAMQEPRCRFRRIEECRAMKNLRYIALHTVAAATFIFLLQRYGLSASLESSLLWALTFGGCAAGLAYMQSNR